MMMSALYVGRLRHLGHADAQLATGWLTIDGSPVFGNRRPDHTPIKTDLDWDGHAWVALGGFIADASLLRTGRSAKAPQRLRLLVETQFGPLQGLYIATPEAAREDGLGYETQRTYTDDEIDAIYRGALTFLES
ncbi:MAG: hypothetical protein V4564_20945 [Pseudomonadota bacterium]